MKYVFIDANVYLSFYEYSDDDLNKLQALVNFQNTRKLKVINNRQLYDEFKRNREARIQSAISQFSSPSVGKIPRLFDQYKDDNKELRNLVDKAEKLHEGLLTQISTAVESYSLTADNLVKELFKSVKDERNQELLTKAKERVSFGNPPGKRGSLGDAYHWEHLLSEVPNEHDLAIVTGDKDWISPVSGLRLNDYMRQEWEEKKKSKIKLYRTIREYFGNEYPDIKLDGKYQQDLWIDNLMESGSFDRSRSVLLRLSGLGDFTDEQLQKIVRASIDNSQIYNAHEYSPDVVGGRLWDILGDRVPDVTKDEWEKFCKKFEMPIDLSDLPF